MCRHGQEEASGHSSEDRRTRGRQDQHPSLWREGSPQAGPPSIPPGQHPRQKGRCARTSLSTPPPAGRVPRPRAGPGGLRGREKPPTSTSSVLISNDVFNRNFKVHYGMWIN